jgi:hypothetical protein
MSLARGCPSPWRVLREIQRSQWNEVFQDTAFQLLQKVLVASNRSRNRRSSTWGPRYPPEAAISPVQPYAAAAANPGTLPHKDHTGRGEGTASSTQQQKHWCRYECNHNHSAADHITSEHRGLNFRGYEGCPLTRREEIGACLRCECSTLCTYRYVWTLFTSERRHCSRQKPRVSAVGDNVVRSPARQVSISGQHRSVYESAADCSETELFAIVKHLDWQRLLCTL